MANHSRGDQGIPGVSRANGINRLPEIRDYWANDMRLHYTPIAERIPVCALSRFLDICTLLITLPARREEGYNRLQKIQPIITAIKERCLRNHRPTAENSVDEAMIPFKG